MIHFTTQATDRPKAHSCIHLLCAAMLALGMLAAPVRSSVAGASERC